MKMLLLEELLSIAPLTIPVGTLVKFHSSQIKSYSPPPVVHKFVKTKVFDLYSDIIQVGPGRCHLEQMNYYFKFVRQIQVATISHFHNTFQ